MFNTVVHLTDCGVPHHGSLARDRSRACSLARTRSRTFASSIKKPSHQPQNAGISSGPYAVSRSRHDCLSRPATPSLRRRRALGVPPRESTPPSPTSAWCVRGCRRTLGRVRTARRGSDRTAWEVGDDASTNPHSRAARRCHLSRRSTRSIQRRRRSSGATEGTGSPRRRPVIPAQP